MRIIGTKDSDFLGVENLYIADDPIAIGSLIHRAVNGEDTGTKLGELRSRMIVNAR